MFSTVFANSFFICASAGKVSPMPVDVNHNFRSHSLHRTSSRPKKVPHHPYHHLSVHKNGAPVDDSSGHQRVLEKQRMKHLAQNNQHNIAKKNHIKVWPKAINMKDFMGDIMDPMARASIQTTSKVQGDSTVQDGPQHGDLSSYCSGSSSSSAQEGMTIEANWKEYGTYYKGRITEVNSDGTYDIKYDDGYTEKNVDREDVRKKKTKGHKVNPGKTDPACKVYKEVADLRQAIHESQTDMRNYLHYRREKKRRKTNRGPAKKPARHKGARQLKEEKKKDSGGYVKRKKGESISDWIDRFWAEWRKKYGGGKDGAKQTAKAIDKNDDKKVTKDEIKAGLQEQGHSEASAEEVSTEMMKKYDKEGTGEISVEDFEKASEEAEKEAKDKEDATKALKDLSEKLGNKEEVRKAVDQDGDESVTEEEVATALEEQAGKTREESVSLAKKIMKALGAADGGSVSADKLEEATKAAIGEADDTGSEGPAYEDQDLSELSDEEKEELIKSLKDEVKDRDKELVEREEAVGKFRDKIEEFKDTMRKDHEEEDARQIPDTPEGKDAEIQRLRAKIMKRAESLDDVLAREEAERQKADYQEAQENQRDGFDQKAMLEKMDRHSQRIKEMTEKLKNKVKTMEGDMDPELASMVNKVSGAADKMTHKMDQVVTTERKLDAKRRSGEDLQDPEATAAAEEELDRQIEELDKDVQHLKQDTAKIDTDIVPHGDKWWRYRWEYSFVESMLLILFCSIAIFWEGIHRLMRKWIRTLSKTSPFFNAAHHHDTMYSHWWVFMCGEMFVLLLVVFTLWVFNRCGIYDWWINIQFDLFPNMHLPPNAKLYARQGNDIAMQVFFAMLSFFGFMFCIVVSAVHKENQWKSCEDPNIPVHTSRSMVSLVTDEEEFLILKDQFATGISAHPDLQAEAAVINSPDFKFWLYLALNVRHNMTNIYMIKIITWIALLIFFILFCFLHLYAHMAWIRLFAFFGSIMVLAFLFMFYKVFGRVKELDEEADRKDVKEFKAKGDSFEERYNTEAWMGTLLQFVIFFCCYGVARIIVSPWLWTYYFWTALLCVIGFLVFLFLFRMFCAPLLVVFMVIMALPPHLDPINLAILKEVQVLSKENIGMDHPSARLIPDRDD